MKKKLPPTISRPAESSLELPMLLSRLSAGFPSPADDYVEEKIDLNKLLVKNKPATYLVRVTGDSMIGAAICDGDILVVDASLRPRQNQIVVACLDGEFLVKRWCTEKNGTYLKSENPSYAPRYIHPDDDFSIFGLVTGVVRQVK